MPKSRIAHKRTSTSGLLPNTTNSSNAAYIAAGELAVNLSDRKIVSSTGSVPFEVGANLTSLYVGSGEITANATHLKLGSAALFANGSNGTSGQVLTSNGTSAYWAAAGGGGSPGGSTTEIQFNDGGSFAGSANLTFDKTNALLTLGNTTVNAQFFGNTGDIRFNQITTTALTLTANSLGFRGCPHNEQAGDYTFTIHDAGKAVVHTKTAAGTSNWTVPNTASVPFPIGTMIVLDNSYYSSFNIANIHVSGISTGVGIRLVGGAEPNNNRQYTKSIARTNTATLKKMANQGTTTKSISAMTGGGTTTTTVTMATSNTIAEINVFVGDYVIIAGGSVSAHNGLHRVLSSSGTGGTSFTFQTAATTTASTGTMTVRKAELWAIAGSFGNINV